MSRVNLHPVPIDAKPQRKRAPAKKRQAPAKRMGVVAQVQTALERKNRLATLLGALLGALVPIITYAISHYELAVWDAPWSQASAYIVLGGLVYSAITVYQWGRLAFASATKAAGFVILTEGAMILSEQGWLGAVVLVYLAVINAIATGATLAVGSPSKGE